MLRSPKICQNFWKHVIISLNSDRISMEFWCSKIRMIRSLGNRIFQPWPWQQADARGEEVLRKLRGLSFGVRVRSAPDTKSRPYGLWQILWSYAKNRNYMKSVTVEKFQEVTRKTGIVNVEDLGWPWRRCRASVIAFHWPELMQYHVKAHITRRCS